MYYFIDDFFCLVIFLFFYYLMLNLLNWCSNFLIFTRISQPFCSTFWDISSNLSFTFFVEFFIFATRNFQKLFLFVLTMFFSYNLLFLFCGCSVFLSLRMLKIFKKNFLLLHTLFPLLPFFCLFALYSTFYIRGFFFFYPLEYLIILDC